MNEESIKAAFEQEELEDELPENEEQEQDVEYSAEEQEARSMGHTSKEEWVAAGKDPSRWKSAHEFVEYGRINEALNKTKAEMDKIKADFDKRLKDVNKFNKAQMEAKIKELKEQQRVAVSEADTEGFDKVQKQIDDLQIKDEPIPPGKDPYIAEWESKNDWVNNPNDPRTLEANVLFSGYLAAKKGATNQEALDYVDKKIKALFPENNPRREVPTGSERSTQQVKRSSKVSMSDLTQDERSLWNSAGFELWGGDEKAFLQSVQDSRKS